ncbi:MAG: oligosaccharide flippase family protein [Lachnospiraceae bacterium]|nr:oligosaccharide flippase family protein [Lachnospiraceae bacterium]
MRVNNLYKNVGSLFVFNVSKMIFPFLILPYLTRVLSTDSYGVVAYVKAVMSYLQIFVDFGFMLSSTRDIARAEGDKNKIQDIIGITLLARLVLGLVAGILLYILTYYLPILHHNLFFTFLSYAVVILSIFLMDFLFRGLEIMHIITFRFILMKTISTLLTFVFVKNDADILLIPIFDIVSSCFAIVLVYFELKKIRFRLCFGKIKNVVIAIKESGVFFISNFAATSFNLLSTLLIGIFLNATDVAIWSVCIQLISAGQACYTPIIDGIYPEMVKTRNIKLIKKILKYFIPIIGFGCMIVFGVSKYVLFILGGEKYVTANLYLNLLLPTIFFGFLSMLFGWPTLGAIDKIKETSMSTFLTVFIHASCLFGLIMVNKFDLFHLAILRSITEVVLWMIRYIFYRRNISLFRDVK